MNSSIPLLTVTVLSILSISLQAVYLQTHPNNPSSVVAIVALALMFVTPMAKVYLGAIGEWIFIVTSLVSLGAQGYAFGHGIGKPEEILVGLSLISTILASYVGHYMKPRKSERKTSNFKSTPSVGQAASDVGQYMFFSFVQFLATVIPIVFYILWSQMDGYSSTLIEVWIVTLISLVLYSVYSALSAFMEPDVLSVYAATWMCTSDKSILEWMQESKALKIVLSALAFSGLTIVYGNTESVADLVSVITFTVALVAEHVNALYFKQTYYQTVRRRRRITWEN